MSLADELLADLEDDNDDEELEELIKEKVDTDDEGKHNKIMKNQNKTIFLFRYQRRA